MTATYNSLRSKVFELCNKLKYKDAIALCQDKIEKAKSENERVRMSLLIPYILGCEGRLSESEEKQQAIIDASGLHRGELYDTLLTLINQGDHRLAITTADQLIEVDAKFPLQSFTSSAYFHKAYAAWKLRRFRQAMAALDKSDEKGAIWIDGHLLSRRRLASNISRKKPDPV